MIKPPVINKKIFFLLVTFGVCCLSLLSQPEPGRTLVLKGATLIDGLGGPPLPEAIVVVTGDRIQSIQSADSSYPSEAEMIDLSGEYIIPGLIESHAHHERWMGEVYLNYGVTTVLAVGEDLNELKGTSRKAAARTPRIFDSAGKFPLSPDMSRDQVHDSIQRWLQKKPDFANLPPFDDEISQVYRWAAEEVHQAGLMVFGHTENAPESIRAGQDVVEHIWGFVEAQMSPQELQEFREGRHLHWSTFIRDWDSLDQMIRETVTQGVDINPTLFFELGSLSPSADKHEREAYQLYSSPDLMAYFPGNIAASLLQKQRQMRNFSSPYQSVVFLSELAPAELQELQRGYQLALEFLNRFVRAGGKLQAGTDSPSGGTPGLSLHQEMELFVEAGLTPMQALQSATHWSVAMLAGKNGARGNPRLGSLVPGNFADLVILTANPLEDITNSQKIERVMKGGRFVDLGYTPTYFSFTESPRKISMATPVPEISSISPHTVVEGSDKFELVVKGVGFMGTSVVRLDDISIPTLFIGPRELRTKISAQTVERATPNPWRSPGPYQKIGIFGDRTIRVRVFNPPPEGGSSEGVSLRVRAKWMAAEK